ncbi:MAG TPA: hypothetical protein VNI77_02760, partial [Nitrososphaera sp.]|nr:hypothetical protein [Nitrososphaera sp.]
GFSFSVESAALSIDKLIQHGWIAVPHDSNKPVPDGYTEVPTITYQQLIERYGKFDTVVADCEGCLYFAIKHFPEILDDINILILEDDAFTNPHANPEFIYNKLAEHGFRLVSSMDGQGFKDFIKIWIAA